MVQFTSRYCSVVQYTYPTTEFSENPVLPQCVCSAGPSWMLQVPVSPDVSLLSVMLVKGEAMGPFADLDLDPVSSSTSLIPGQSVNTYVEYIT